MKWAELVVGAALFNSACESSRVSGWIRKDLAAELSFSHGESEQVLDVWRSGGDSLRLRHATSTAAIQKKIKNQKLVMVNISSTSELALSLENDPRTLAYLRRGGGDTVAVLVALADGLVADALATAAHAASGHICGALTPVNLHGLTTPDANLIPPIYPEAAALAPVSPLLLQVDQNRILASVRELEALGTRFHASESGLTTTAKLKAMFPSPPALAADISEFDHTGTTHTVPTAQKSLIVALPGETEDAVTVVIGAHLDSINRAGGLAPGADDDASGVATLVEIAQVIAQSGVRFHRRIEFHAYAGEEVGLIGSRHIAATYRAADRKVAAMMQFDMNSWSRDPSRQTVHLVANDTHINLRRSLKDLLNTYLGGDFVEKRLAGGTSDHRSWTDEGYAAVFPFEDPGDYNSALHTAADTSAAANNLALTSRFAQLGLAYLAHHAGLIDADADTAKTALRAALPSDLKIAIIPAENPTEGYKLSIAAPAGIAGVDFCVIGVAGSLGCVKERTLTGLIKAEGERQLFAAAHPVPLNADSRLAVFGFDSMDRLVAYRTVRLLAKP